MTPPTDSLKKIVKTVGDDKVQGFATRHIYAGEELSCIKTARSSQKLKSGILQSRPVMMRGYSRFSEQVVAHIEKNPVDILHPPVPIIPEMALTQLMQNLFKKLH